MNTQIRDLVLAVLFGFVISLVMFLVWAPHDAAYEAQMFLKFLNHSI